MYKRQRRINNLIGIALAFITLNCSAATKQKTVLEVVIFTTKSNISAQKVLLATNKVTKILKTIPGFMTRTIGKGQQPHQWIDIVKWRSMQQALAAPKLVENKPQMKHFVALIKSYKMYHFYLKQSLIK